MNKIIKENNIKCVYIYVDNIVEVGNNSENITFQNFRLLNIIISPLLRKN